MFSDVKAGAYYEPSIIYLSENGYIHGYKDGTFRPNQAISRAEVAQIIVNALNINKEKTTYSTFTDTKNHWAEKSGAIGAAQSAEIIAGDGNGIFRPNDSITRAEVAQIIVNTWKLTAQPNFQSNFTDLYEVPWASQAITIVHSHQLVSGKGNATFDPKGKTTRAEFATMIYNSIQAFGNERPEVDDSDKKVEPTEPNISDKTETVVRIDDIKKKWSLLQPQYNGPTIEVEPITTPPYRLGKIHKQALQDAVNMTNFVRYLAFLPNNISLNEEYTKEAQAAALVNAANQVMTHFPTQPVQMEKALYELGYEGAKTSNIGYGYLTLIRSIQNGYMPDFSDKNREHVGHRRWILSPRLQEVGFGYAIAEDGVAHSAMKVIAPNMWSHPETPYKHISWPSELAFPTEFFGMRDPWSVSLHPSEYDVSKINDITVTLTRLTDGKKWTFHRGTKKDGYFNISTDNYGYTPFTIIFQPKQETAYQAGEQYRVEINGLYSTKGKKTSFQYETTFFDLGV